MKKILSIGFKTISLLSLVIITSILISDKLYTPQVIERKIIRPECDCVGLLIEDLHNRNIISVSIKRIIPGKYIFLYRHEDGSLTQYTYEG